MHTPVFFFFFNDTATTEIYTLSLHDALPISYERCRSEARAAFGVDGVYVERLMTGARHIEVQILGDGGAGPIALGERECTLQRRFQKLVEIAPSPSLAQQIGRAHV